MKSIFLHIADMREAVKMADELNEYICIVADVNNDREYNAITNLVDELQCFKDTIEDIFPLKDTFSVRERLSRG